MEKQRLNGKMTTRQIVDHYRKSFEKVKAIEELCIINECEKEVIEDILTKNGISFPKNKQENDKNTTENLDKESNKKYIDETEIKANAFSVIDKMYGKVPNDWIEGFLMGIEIAIGNKIEI